MKTFKLALHGQNKKTVKATDRQDAARQFRKMYPNLKIVAHREIREVKA